MATGIEDAAALTVTSTTPADSSRGVAVDSRVTVSFDKPIDPSTISAATFTVMRSDESVVEGSIEFDLGNRRATFVPSSDLAFGGVFEASVSTGVEDIAGNRLAMEFVWTFTTAAAPAGDVTSPMISSTIPFVSAAGVAVNQRIVASFSEAMNTSSIEGAFNLVGPGGTPILGSLSYDITGSIATFTPDVELAPNTTYTARVTTSAEDLTGNAIAEDFEWTFTTGVTSDTTRPLVNAMNPAAAATGVEINAAVTATFSEPVNPSTVTVATITVTGPGGASVLGSVTYAAVSNTARFAPVSNLAPDTTYTVTVTTGVRDLAGNALAVNKTWMFRTTSDPSLGDTVAPTVTSTNPADHAINVSINQSINVTFSELMDASTISTARYTLIGPGTTSIAGTVSYEVASRIATFVPLANLTSNTTYTARITDGVEDLAGNALMSDFVWQFTTASAPSGEPPVILRSLSAFAAVAGAGLTNSNSAGQTTINGDVGLSPTGTCLGDGIPCTALNPLINGTLYANDSGGVAAAAKADLTLAYNDAAGRPPGTTVNDLSGLVLAPGVYTSGSTMSIAVGGTLTLDGQGDASGVWIFQIGSSLTVNNSAQVILINGAKASNVFWAIFASSTLGTNVVFKGNVLAGASNSVGTGSTVEGRLLCRDGQITLLSNTITTPAP